MRLAKPGKNTTSSTLRKTVKSEIGLVLTLAQKSKKDQKMEKYSYENCVTAIKTSPAEGYSAAGYGLLNETIRCISGKSHRLGELIGLLSSKPYKRIYSLAVKAFCTVTESHIVKKDTDGVAFFKVIFKDASKAKALLLENKNNFKNNFFSFCQNFESGESRQKRILDKTAAIADFASIVKRYRKAGMSDEEIRECFSVALQNNK